MENNRGYSMPLMTNKKEMKWVLFLLPPMLFLLFILEYRDIAPEGTLDTAAMVLLTVLIGCLTVAYLGLLVGYFAQLHFVPEGVAVTAFGLTLRRIPAKRIRLITAAHAVYKGSTIDKIALCDYSLEELTAHAHASKPKLFRNSREFRTGEWADEYLTRRLIRGLRPNRRIFWLWWDPERLEALRSMYPQAQWMDLTKDKIFDKQLKTEVKQ